jgi:hypothetical protein
MRRTRCGLPLLLIGAFAVTYTLPPKAVVWWEADYHHRSGSQHATAGGVCRALRTGPKQYAGSKPGRGSFSA